MTDQSVPAEHPSRVGQWFIHGPVKRLEELRSGRPAQTDEMRVGLNGRIGLQITKLVGTMWAAYIFCVIALIGAYAIIGNNSTLNLVIILISQTFLQLVLLPIIIVGQNIQGAASDKRAADTYKDAEAILEQCVQLQKHLMAQDKILDDVLAHLHEETAAAS